MEYSILGNTGLEASRIGFGCAAMGGYDYGPVDDNESIRAVRKALDLGINLFDVADVYGFGHAESVLGKALSTARGSALIASKIGVRWDPETRRTVRDNSRAYITEAVEASLKRLSVERIDICQLHWPVLNVPPAEAMDPLVRMQQEGKIGLLGVCNATPEWLEVAQRFCRIDLLQLPCNVLERKNLSTLLSARIEYDMFTITYNSLAHGLLTGKVTSRSEFHATDLRNRVTSFMGSNLTRGLEMAEAIRQVAVRIGRSSTQVAIRWLLDRPEISCVLTGVKTVEQIEENSLSTGWSLPEDARVHLAHQAESLLSDNGDTAAQSLKSLPNRP